LSQEQAIFESHSDYFKVLAYLNLKDRNVLNNLVNENQSENLKKLISLNIKDGQFENIPSLLTKITQEDLSKTNLSEQDQTDLRLASMDLLEKLYNKVLYPNKDEANNV